MVECHGTGTYLGDPIEVAALTEAYRAQTDASDFCRIGSVKTNIGHLDTAAGVAGLAKATLALHHKQMPPSLGYEAPNPAIPFEGSPFRVNDTLTDWAPRNAAPRRDQCVGRGRDQCPCDPRRSARTRRVRRKRLAVPALVLSGDPKRRWRPIPPPWPRICARIPNSRLADVAFTLKNGRRAFDKRRVVVAETHDEAAALLEADDTRRVFSHERLGENPEVVFMFPGGGAQYAGMARDLYETEPVFAEWMDRGLDHLHRSLIMTSVRCGCRKRSALLRHETLKKPSVQLPLIAIVEYALAQLWMSGA